MSIEDFFLSGSDGLISGVPNIVLILGGILLVAFIVLLIFFLILLHKKNKLKRAKSRRRSRPNTKGSRVGPAFEERAEDRQQMRLAEIVTQLLMQNQTVRSPNSSSYGSRGSKRFMD